jgi:hypothetical protein
MITQHVHIFPCSNLAIKVNNGNNRILYHDIAAKTITEPPPCYTVGTRCFGLQAALAVLKTQILPDVGNSVKDESSDHITRAFLVVSSRFYGRGTIIYTSEHYFQ